MREDPMMGILLEHTPNLESPSCTTRLNWFYLWLELLERCKNKAHFLRCCQLILEFRLMEGWRGRSVWWALCWRLSILSPLAVQPGWIGFTFVYSFWIEADICHTGQVLWAQSRIWVLGGVMRGDLKMSILLEYTHKLESPNCTTGLNWFLPLARTFGKVLIYITFFKML